MDSVFAPLAAARAYRVSEIWRPRDPGDRGAGHRGGAQRAALTAAYHAGIAGAGGGTVAFGWVRTAAGGPVHVLTVGEALVGSADAAAGEVLLSLPCGARGAALRREELGWLTGQLGCWREVAGISDALLAATAAGGREPAAALDDGLLGNWTGPFGWLVIAEPVGRAQLEVLLADAGSRLRAAEGAAGRYPLQAALARRLAERHAELQRGESAGLWRVTVLAGGTDAGSAARVAGLLCASADLEGLPYALSPAPAVAGGPGGAGGDGTASSPFFGSTGLVAALVRAPEAEVPGVRLALRPEFDVTPELAAEGRRLELGQVLDRNLVPAGPFSLAAGSLNRHVFVCGATGGGKSQTVRSLLEAATGTGVPWLVVEPAKSEYRLMAGRIPDYEVVRIRPGEPDAVAAGLNPLEPAGLADGRRFPLQAHADLVKALFTASFAAEEPFPQVLGAALTRVYEDAGWDLALGEPRRADGERLYPTLAGLQRAAERVVSEIGYSDRVTDDVLGFVRVRLASLGRGTSGRFLEGGHRLDFAALLRKNVVLELEDVGDDADKSFLMGTVLIRLAEHLRLAHRGGTAAGLRHLTVIEEAHRLLRRPGSGGHGGAAGHAVELFAGLLAEVRAYGEGLVIAEQIPERLVPDVIKNTAVKIVHRLPAADDREAVGATINATPAQSRYLVTLPPGQAAAFADGMDFPVLIMVKDGTRRERPEPETSDARALVRPRAASCGSECAVRACTLREMRHAQQLLEDEPWVEAWARLGVLAHLTGWPAPVPGPERLAVVRALPARTVQCAVSHAAETAVSVSPLIRRPGALAVHVAEVLRARAERGEWFCAPEETEWVLTGAVPAGIAEGLLEAVAKDPACLEIFIECRWPLNFLPTEEPGPESPGAADGPA
jgi:DNA helicase HerA-like ATPase